MHRLSFLTFSAAACALAACEQQQPAAEDNAAEEPVLNLPAVPRPDPPIDRASLLAAIAAAASAKAAGASMPETVSSLDGRQFELRIRFGCRGPSTELRDRWLGWSYDPEERRIRVRAKPTISKEDPLVAEFSGADVEAVEGFWIPRPWLLQSVCPTAAAVQTPSDGSQADVQPGGRQQGPQARESQQQQRASRDAGAASADDQRGEPVPTPPRFGIAQFFTSDDPRTRRRNSRPYESAHTLAEGHGISSQGYDLVLSGRLRALPDRGVIQCSARGPDSPPECVVSAEFLRVWIEQPGTEEVIAEWGGG